MLTSVLAEFQSRPKVPKYALTCIHTLDGYTSDRAKTACTHTNYVIGCCSPVAEKRKDYTFRRQFNEKPSIISGCPGTCCRYEDVCSLDIIVAITFLVHTLQAGLELPAKGQNYRLLHWSRYMLQRS